jgi:hypothetical protein
MPHARGGAGRSQARDADVPPLAPAFVPLKSSCRIRMQKRVSRALLTCAALVLLLCAGADDDLERIMPDVEVL